MENPRLLETDSGAIIESALWFWFTRHCAKPADDSRLDELAAVTAVTRKINPALEGNKERQENKQRFTKLFVNQYGRCLGLQKQLFIIKEHI